MHVSDVQRVFQLQSEIFGLPPEHFEMVSKRDPYFTPDNILTASYGNELVSALQLFPKRVRFGKCSIMAGGIGNVGTHPSYRKKGLASKLLREAVGLMKRRGYRISLLFTRIPDFYRKLGWKNVAPHYEYAISMQKLREKASPKPQAGMCRVFKDDDLSSVMEIYESTNRLRTLSAIRSVEHWRRMLAHPLNEDLSLFTVIEMGGKMLAYIRCNMRGDVLEIIEAGCTSDPPNFLFKSLLSHIAGLGMRIRCGGVKIYAPPDHPFVNQFSLSGAQDLTKPEGPMMAKILNLKGLLRDVLPELSERVSGLDPSAGLTIKTEEERASLKIRGSEVLLTEGNGYKNIYKTSQGILAQNLMGYLSPTEAVRRGLADGDPRAVKLADKLFKSEMRAHMWNPDRF
jgi:predicted acetyltransferase